MNKTIVVAGATGNLGGKITDALLKKGAKVIAIVRLETEKQKITILEEKGVIVKQIDTWDKSEIAKHCIGASCMVSALAGLKETVIDAQKVFLDAAVEAKVNKFIPSDFSIDFTNLVEGKNRNLDWRRAFHRYLESQPIQSTTIFNGPFMDLLTTDMPLILFKQKRILCWGNPNQKMEFTTTHDVADFTAEAALEDSTPRFLRISGDVRSCNDFVELLTRLTGTKYKLFRPGGINLLNVMIRLTRFFAPTEKELYPAWQGMQYMRDMMEGRIIFQDYENNRYPDLKWTSVENFLTEQVINKG
jgi:nucleoside-diphosphate-sugar epimerase